MLQLPGHESRLVYEVRATHYCRDQTIVHKQIPFFTTRMLRSSSRSLTQLCGRARAFVILSCAQTACAESRIGQRLTAQIATKRTVETLLRDNRFPGLLEQQTYCVGAYKFCRTPYKAPSSPSVTRSASNQNCCVHVWDRSDRPIVATALSWCTC